MALSTGGTAGCLSRPATDRWWWITRSTTKPHQLNICFIVIEVFHLSHYYFCNIKMYILSLWLPDSAGSSKRDPLRFSWNLAHRGFSTRWIQWRNQFAVTYDTLTSIGQKLSHQKVTPSDFHENLHTKVLQHAEYNSKISSASHIILWLPEVKKRSNYYMWRRTDSTILFRVFTNSCVPVLIKSERVTFW